jgi:hypothetical protein
MTTTLEIEPDGDGYRLTGGDRSGPVPALRNQAACMIETGAAGQYADPADEGNDALYADILEDLRGRSFPCP